MTMNKEFVVASIQMATYERKEGTQVSFYWKEGEKILPNRMSISLKNLFADAKVKGRMTSKTEPVVGDLKGKFTQKEKSESPLNQNGGEISTKLFQSVEFPQFCYGVIAVSNPETGRTDKEEGMVVIRQLSESVIELFYMSGVTCNPSDKIQVFEVVSELIG